MFVHSAWTLNRFAAKARCPTSCWVVMHIVVEVANGDCFALYESFDKMPDAVEFVEVLPLASIMGGSPHSIFGNPRLPDVSLPLHQVTVGLQCTLGLWGGCTMVLLIFSRVDTLSKKNGLSIKMFFFAFLFWLCPHRAYAQKWVIPFQFHCLKGYHSLHATFSSLLLTSIEPSAYN